jgi:hypothetical protein
MPLDPISIGLEAVPFALNLGRSLFGESEADQYKRAQEENVQRVVGAIQANSAKERARIERRRARDLALSQQSGARQRASRGYTGNVSAFTDPSEARIQDTTQEALTSLGESETAQIASAEAGSPTLPDYAFPQPLDYLSTGAGFVGKAFGQQSIIDLLKGMYQTGGVDTSDIGRLKKIGFDTSSSIQQYG